VFFFFFELHIKSPLLLLILSHTIAALKN